SANVQGGHMADLGIHGVPARPAGMSRIAHTEQVLNALPDVFTRMWISDHLQIDGEPIPEAWTRLTYLAAAFPRFHFGHMVLSQSYRNPALLAVMAQTLQEFSGGRFILGLGAGWLEEEYRSFNYPYPSGGTRVAQLAEAITLIKRLWTKSPATFHGEHYHIDGAICATPDPPIPVMVGTNGPKALKVVARLADWWVWDGPWEVSYRRPYEILRAECEAIGRPFEEIQLVAELTVSLPDDVTTFQSQYEHGFYPGQVFGVAGPTAVEIIREIEQLVDVGVRHVAINFEDQRQLERFVDEVVPHLRLEPKAAPGSATV
ncbi:MAG TPA: LLM class flavin-dependent oxidoreductase, partial [Candidatus Limnocylindrales bacterium]|nr:LLM class flavin-dependent oxidoreductase [Candidatus Limnocylindrales bacterium]